MVLGLGHSCCLLLQRDDVESSTWLVLSDPSSGAVTLSAPRFGAGSWKGAGDTAVGNSSVLSRIHAPGCSCWWGSHLFLRGYRSVETAGSNNPQRYQISLSVPSKFNYSKSFGYETNVIPVLVIIIHRAVEVALTRSACFDLH